MVKKKNEITQKNTNSPHDIALSRASRRDSEQEVGDAKEKRKKTDKKPYEIVNLLDIKR